MIAKIIKRFLISLGIVFFILFITGVVSFFVLKNLKIKEIVEREIEKSLGINVTIEKIEISALFTHIAVKGITIHNPGGFLEDELAYINSIHILFDPLEVLLKSKPNLYVFALDLQRLNIVKNNDGLVNIEEILPVKDKNAPGRDQTPFYFDVLVFSLGEVNYIDYSQVAKKVNNYPIGIKMATFIGIKDEQEVIKLVVSKAIENTDIGKLINLKIIPVVSQVGDTVDATWGAAKSGARSIWGIAVLPFNLLFGKL
ncbi:MAG: hypothetical protein WCY09_01180 [Candidatus Omnitrophota bacterium]